MAQHGMIVIHYDATVADCAGAYGLSSVNIRSLIPRLSHRLSYVTFRTTSWSWNSSPTILWLPVRYASVYIIHMNSMCVTQNATRGTVKSELGQWIRINIGCARLKRNLDLISVPFSLSPCTALGCAIKASVVRKAKNRLPSKLWSTKIIPNLLVNFQEKFIFSYCRWVTIKQLTNEIVWNGKSITSMW